MSLIILSLSNSIFFFFNDTATSEIYTLSLHDALPIFEEEIKKLEKDYADLEEEWKAEKAAVQGTQHIKEEIEKLKDRKSTRLNSSHLVISYAVFCLKKKKTYKYVSHRL